MRSSEQRKLILSTKSLETRLNINDSVSQTNFHGWLNDHLAVRKGMDVLDVGCGNGAQASRFLRKVGPSGSVSALDLSSTSIESLQAATAGAPNMQAIAIDMAKTGLAISRTFRIKRYDLAQTTYSLYYSARPLKVLDAMREALKPGGRLAVCTPNNPHTLSLFCGRFAPLSPNVVACGRFGTDVLEPYFRKHFVAVDIHLLRNELRFPTADQVLDMMRNAAYFDPANEPRLRRAVQGEIRRRGYFPAEKNSYLIIGRAPTE